MYERQTFHTPLNLNSLYQKAQRKSKNAPRNAGVTRHRQITMAQRMWNDFPILRATWDTSGLGHLGSSEPCTPVCRDKNHDRILDHIGFCSWKWVMYPSKLLFIGKMIRQITGSARVFFLANQSTDEGLRQQNTMGARNIQWWWTKGLTATDSSHDCLDICVLWPALFYTKFGM